MSEHAVRARDGAFEAAVRGRPVVPVPVYVVSADPSDGAFVVLLLGPELSEAADPLRLGAATVAGDVRRRFEQQVRGEVVDGFAGLRVPWPGPDGAVHGFVCGERGRCGRVVMDGERPVRCGRAAGDAVHAV